MSGSLKKVPIIKFGGYGKYGKHISNKKVRRNYSISDGNNYKKIYDSWDIFDYKSNLYKVNKIDGMPIYEYSKNRMTFDEIMEYWRK